MSGVFALSPHASKPISVDQDDSRRLGRRLAELRAIIRAIEPHRLATLTNTSYTEPEAGDINVPGRGIFDLRVLDQDVYLTYPELTVYNKRSGEELSLHIQALILYYFSHCDGTPPSEHWISFSELPDGRFYNQAFQGYTGKEIVHIFGDDVARLEQAAQSIGGEPYPLGDKAFIFHFLPLIPLLLVYWRGDEDLASTCQVLFDAAVSHHLPTDACAVLGSNLTHRLIEQKG